MQLVFTLEDPRKDGYTGEVIEGVVLEQPEQDVHKWDYGTAAPEVVVGRHPTEATRRFRGGKQMVMAGGRRGLTLPNGWQDKPGPVFVMEGASDTLAMTHTGLNCVGRPSNSGGADMLTTVLHGRTVACDIVVVGENDIKTNGDWPGRTGAERVAKTERPVRCPTG